MHNRPHRYDIGQKLLCFEPDNTKAKLIYFAKIIDQVPQENTNTVHYIVHFHGWKCKWDREVPEDLLLENNEFNRTLKRKIDEVAQHVRGRYRRKQRIDMILESAALSGDDINWDTVPGVWKGKKSRKSCQRSVSSDNKKEKTPISSPSFGENMPVWDEFIASTLDQEELTQLQFEQLQIHKAYMVSLDLPQNLRNILKSHTDASDLGKDVSKTFRYWCSVLQLLQKYVDGFPYSGLDIISLLGSCSSSSELVSDRASRIMNPLYSQTDQNRLICAEVCSSLRILFDFTLRNYLLLPSEKSRSVNNQLYEGGRVFGENFPHGPTDIHSTFRFSSPQYELLPNCEALKNPKLPCLNYPPYFLLRLFTILPTLLNGMELTLCRRAIVHRHLYMFIHYIDRTTKFWFDKSWLNDVDMRPVLVKSEQPPIQSSTSEFPSDTEPFTTNNKSLRRTTRNTRKSQLSDLSNSTKTLYENESPTVTLNTQSISVNFNDLIEDSNINISLVSSSVSTALRTLSKKVMCATMTTTKKKYNTVNRLISISSQSQVKHTNQSVPLLNENKILGKVKVDHNLGTTTTTTTTTRKMSSSMTTSVQDNLDNNIRVTRSIALRNKNANYNPNPHTYSLRGK